MKTGRGAQSTATASYAKAGRAEARVGTSSTIRALEDWTAGALIDQHASPAIAGG